MSTPSSSAPRDFEKDISGTTPSVEMENGEVISREFSSESSFDYAKQASGTSESKPRGWFGNIIDGFKRPEDYNDLDHLTKQEKAIEFLGRAKPALSKRHVMVIAASSGVGTGLFVGSGNSLKLAGPAALLIGFAVMGFNLLCIIMCIGELAVRYPSMSPIYEFPARFIDPSYGFAVGWIYSFCWLVTIPLELIAAAMVTQYWKDDNNAGAKANPVAWVAILYVFDFVINFGGSRAFAELEFVIGMIKVVSVIGWIIFCIINVAGGPPYNHYIGGYNFSHPAAFTHAFKGVVQVLVSASFAFGATEVSGMAAAETPNPLKSLPSAVKQVFWRVVVFFIISILMIGLMVPSDAPGLGSSNNGTGSPFIIALKTAGVKGLPSVINAVIMCSVVGVSNAAIYAGSRTMTTMAIKGGAPSFLCYIDRKGRPLASLLVCAIFSLLCFVAASDEYSTVFDWLYAFASLAFFFAWGSACICFLRVRWVFRKRGRSTDEFLYKSPLGVFGGICGTVITFGTLGLQFWVYIFPISADPNIKLKPDPEYFFQNDLSIPFFIFLFVVHKIVYWKSSKFVTDSEMDIDSGVREIDFDRLREIQEEDRIRARKNPLIRLGNLLC